MFSIMYQLPLSKQEKYVPEIKQFFSSILEETKMYN